MKKDTLVRVRQFREESAALAKDILAELKELLPTVAVYPTRKFYPPAIAERVRGLHAILRVGPAPLSLLIKKHCGHTIEPSTMLGWLYGNTNMGIDL